MKKNPWKTLEVLDVSDCDLHELDLRSLSRANAYGHLPRLKHLGLAENRPLWRVKNLFHEKVPWRSLERLNLSDRDLHRAELKSLSEASARGYLPALKHLDLNNTSLDECLDMLIKPHAFASLEMLTLRRLTDSDADSLLQALDEGRFPKLHTVAVHRG